MFLVNQAASKRLEHPGTVEVMGRNPAADVRRWLATCSSFNLTTCPVGRCAATRDACQPTDGGDWEYDERLQWVRLQFRLQGAAEPDSWHDALDEGGSVLELRDAESSIGGARGHWRVPDLDGIYEIRLKAQCSVSSGPEFDQATSDIITGVIDRQPPRLFSRFNEPADGIYLPGDIISSTW